MENKTKKKYWGSVSKILFALMFVSSWTVLGIAIAIKTATINISGQITFKATDVQVTVSDATFTDFGSGTTDKCKGFTLDASTTTEQLTAQTSTWAGLTLTFKDTGADAIMTYTITNTDQDQNAVKVVFGGTGDNAITGLSGTNSTMEISAQEGSLSGSTFTATSGVSATQINTAAGATVNLDYNKTLQVTIKFKITNTNKDASISNFKIPVEMSKVVSST